MRFAIELDLEPEEIEALEATTGRPAADVVEAESKAAVLDLIRKGRRALFARERIAAGDFEVGGQDGPPVERHRYHHRHSLA